MKFTRSQTIIVMLMIALSLVFSSDQAQADDCVASENRLCLLGQRFAVDIEWWDSVNNDFAVPGMQCSKQAKGTAFSDDTGVFFLSDDSAEILVKVLDGTSLTGSFWVFAAGATNHGVNLLVTDMQTGQQREYYNPPGQPFPPITDTVAFAGPKAEHHEPGILALPASCSEDTLCLAGGELEVRVSWQDFQGNQGIGQATSFDDNSGFFSFFAQENLEMVIRIVDGREVNGSYWFAAAAMTNVEFTIEVIDTVSGQQETYHNPLGEAFVSVLDRDPFDVVAEQPWIASLGAAHVSGLAGSEWHDRQLFKARDQDSDFSLLVTPRGQAFDDLSDPRLEVFIEAGKTLVVDDLYLELLGGDGAGTIRLITNPGSSTPIWRSYVYNLSEAGEFGMVTQPFHAVDSAWHGQGTTLAGVLSSAGFRDNIDVTTGGDGLLGTWFYDDGSDAESVEISQFYAADTTVQFSVSSLIDFEPSPAASLEFRIDGGGGRVFLSRNNNGSNDPARDELQP